MTRTRHIDGKPVTDAQIEAWAAEAAEGIDVDTLLKRGRGRPGRALEASQVVSLRFTTEELAAIDARADRENITRSQAIREAVLAYSA